MKAQHTDATTSSTQRFNSHLIRSPHQQPLLQRLAWCMLTLAGWGVYLSLWVPLVSMLRDLSSGRKTWTQVHGYDQYLDPFMVVALPGLMICCPALLIGWAEYNRHRFSGEERRTALENVERSEIARSLGASEALAEQLAAAKAVTLHMDEHARPVGMTLQALQSPHDSDTAPIMPT
ncbi:poly-beta-1,6-N-acetyl-D-glucosamine biosynthesis protein PgaD [Xanthomonas axonopodis pv. vasculorum]|uniref:poly-beta-1,6-N-acetyl-D-glucosamine biosynthesis protein PgaD n=1 Tax=Xanthomonas axonopodis TaxID=53413 RepID=UPI000AD3A7EE|nr:poly-beta-1,6-N-acetyl-D-glucosamine biosynthesis protein PgaD [Xanthomonas axonopodis]PPV09317.1 poly-beta-1,6-N-acetyl-D-glucosamine biosynthesis protein PgaD [Xanthomonas axonopodis pv. vasculorum]QKD87854.1 poly-beta-1,6-N-acetyl-D-glucosamine biosynthesis protein PgaD [Xanthomonas axonopodis pv. vasculorum]